MKAEKFNEKKGPSIPVTVILLLTMFLINVGNFFTYDCPQLFEDQLIVFFGITPVEVGYLYTIYSVPNFIGAPLGGLLLSYVGVAWGSLIFNIMVYLSTVTVFLGIYIRSFWLVFIGRGLFGLGAESLIVAQSAIAEKWFSGKYLSFAIGVNQFFNLFSGSMQALIGPQLFIRTRDIRTPFLAMSCMGVIAMIVNGIYCWTDMLTKDPNSEEEGDMDFMNTSIDGFTAANSNESTNEETADNSSVVGGSSNSSMLEERMSQIQTMRPVFTLSDVRFFSPTFWLLVIIFILISQSYFQFINFSTNFLQHRFSYPYSDATQLITMVQTVAAVTIPIFSLMIVRIGMKGHVLILASGLATTCFSTFYILDPAPSIYVTLCMVGITLTYSLYSAVIWSSMALVVPKEGTSIALAIATTLQNILMTVLPILFGYLNKSQEIEAYNHSILIFIILSSVSTILSIFTTVFDLRRGKVLYLSENDKDVLEGRRRKSIIWKESILDQSADFSILSKQNWPI